MPVRGAWPPGCAVPTAPTNLTATTIDDDQIDLAWTDNSDDETGFRIYRSEDGVSFAALDTVAADVEAYSDTGLDPATQYWYYVVAYNDCGESAASNTDDATTDAAWSPAQATTDGGVLPEHWYRGDDAYEENTRVTPCSDDGDPVGSWTDLTANADHVSRALAAGRPTWEDAELNGHPVIHFSDQANPILLQGAFTTGGTISQPNTTFLVARSTFGDDGDSGVIIAGTSGVANYQIFYKNLGGGSDYTMYAGVVKDGTTAPDTDFHIYTLLWNGAASASWIDGTADISGNAGAQGLSGLTVGTAYDGATEWYGDIAEMLFYETNLSTADKNQIGNYLATRYGLAYTDIV